MHSEHESDVRCQRNRCERRLRIERKVPLQVFVRSQRRVDREKKRIAIGLGIGDRRGPGRPAGAAAIVDDDALPERLAQRLTDDARHGIGRTSGREIDDQRDRTVGIILRSRYKRHSRRRRRAAEQHDELAAPHSITSSARARSVGGTSRPSALAVLSLTTNSYVVGFCTGRSPGFAPLRMRSAYTAPCRYHSAGSVPKETNPPSATK